MPEDRPTLESAVSERRRALAHEDGPLLVVGAPGTGKTELLAGRLAHLEAQGTRPENVLTIASRQATADRLRERCEALLRGPFEELWVGSWDAIGERLLREHSDEAGLDPFFDVLGRAERLAMLLDRLDRLPLRRHEIRGNPAGLLARLLARIDRLKAERVGPTTLSERAQAAQPADEAGREAQRRELEFAELYVAHDRIVAESGSLDRGDVFLALDCLLVERPDVRRRIAERFRQLMVDELEEASPAQRAVLESLAADNPNQVFALEAGADEAWFTQLHPEGEKVLLQERFRDPQLSFWRCTNERAQAQAVARGIEHLIAAGTAAEEICVLVADPAQRGGAVAAAMEERGIPFHLSGPTALFQRPEV
ncbi:MAG TPA: ATP-dependent helicase, partial [Solirubrobacterales bacterium]|nr:ATP-dependent helicase [Solirubrobacterales bacterium]